MKKTVLFPLVALIAAEVVFTAFFLTAKPGLDGFAPRLSTGADICDYRAFIKYCLIEEQPYHPRMIEAHDACYPPIAYCLVGFFPATSTGRNAYVSALAAGLLAGFLVFLFQRSRRGALACLCATLVKLAPGFRTHSATRGTIRAKRPWAFCLLWPCLRPLFRLGRWN